MPVQFDSGNVSIAANLSATEAYHFQAAHVATPGLSLVTLPFGGSALLVTQGGGLGDLRIDVNVQQSAGAAGVLYYKDGSPPDTNTDGTEITWLNGPNWSGNNYTASWHTGVGVDRYFWIRPGTATHLTTATARVRFDYEQDLEVSFSSGRAGFMTWDAVPDVIAYEVNITEGASLNAANWVNTGKTDRRYSFRDLNRGTQYTFGVRGRTALGVSVRSSLTVYTPIASLHNALFFKECVNYFEDGARVTEHGNASNVLRAVADNDYRTFSTKTDYDINIARNGQPTRVDAVFVKCKGVTRHSGTPTGGAGRGWTDVDLPATVTNWEGTAVSTTVAGFQHHLLLLDAHFTATSVRMQFEGAGVEVYEVMLLEFGISIDANGDLLDMNPDFVDREGVVRTDPGGSIVYNSPIGEERDKWEIQYAVKVKPGKTILQTPEEFLYWQMENRNCVHAVEPSRHPAQIFPAVLRRNRVPVRYRTDDKTGGQIISFTVAEA